MPLVIHTVTVGSGTTMGRRWGMTTVLRGRMTGRRCEYMCPSRGTMLALRRDPEPPKPRRKLMPLWRLPMLMKPPLRLPRLPPTLRLWLLMLPRPLLTLPWPLPTLLRPLLTLRLWLLTPLRPLAGTVFA